MRDSMRLLTKLTLIGTITLLFSVQVATAACSTGYTRSNFSTSWTMDCNVPAAFQSKIDQAVNVWNGFDKYTYTKSNPCPALAYAYHYASFTALGFGSNPGTTQLSFASACCHITGAQTYFNSNKTWFDSSTDNASWPANQYDRRTVALHETGHWMYLLHPSQCGQNHPEAVMEPTSVTKLSLRNDDITGLSTLGILGP